MYLSARAHWVKYFYFKELIVTKFTPLENGYLILLPNQGWKLVSRFPLTSWKGCWFKRSADLPNTGTCCCFHGHMHRILRTWKSSLHLLGAAPTLLQVAFTPALLPALPGLTFPAPPQEKLCPLHPARTSLEFKNKPGSSIPGWEQPLCSHQSPIPAVLLPFPAQQPQGAAGSCVCTSTILRKWGCLAELDSHHHYWTSTASWLIKSSNYPWKNACSQGWT